MPRFIYPIHYQLTHKELLGCFAEAKKYLNEYFEAAESNKEHQRKFQSPIMSYHLSHVIQLVESYQEAINKLKE
jgi:hypothetical protein